MVASFFLQLFALLTPLFTQVVIDKVLVHKGFTTLHVLAVGMIALALFDAVSDRRIKRGNLILLEAMGGGFTWGSALLRW